MKLFYVCLFSTRLGLDKRSALYSGMHNSQALLYSGDSAHFLYSKCRVLMQCQDSPMETEISRQTRHSQTPSICRRTVRSSTNDLRGKVAGSTLSWDTEHDQLISTPSFWSLCLWPFHPIPSDSIRFHPYFTVNPSASAHFCRADLGLAIAQSDLIWLRDVV